MTSHEYHEAMKSFASQKVIVGRLKKNNSNFKKEFEKFLDAFITVKGHSLCMDIKSERRKMVKLFVSTIQGLRFFSHK